MFTEQLRRRVRRATSTGSAIQVAEAARLYAWDDDRPTSRNPPYLRRHDDAARRRSATSRGARVLALLGDSRHHRPHLARPATSRRTARPAKYLHGARRAAGGLQPYGARRGNHEVMMRGTFANIRLRNLMVPGTEGGVTVHLPDGRGRCRSTTPPMRYKAGRHAADRPRRQGIRHRLVARLGGQGHHAAGREGGHRRELRAHPPLQPGRHGRAAAAVQGRDRPRSRSA